MIKICKRHWTGGRWRGRGRTDFFLAASVGVAEIGRNCEPCFKNDRFYRALAPVRKTTRCGTAFFRQALHNMKPSSAEHAFAVGAVILAAGRSARMGQPKLLLPWGETSVLGHLIQQWQALGSKQTAVVCADHDATIPAEMDRLRLPAENLIRNPAPERGMFSSIQCAAKWAGWHERLTHWAIVLGDQPHLHHETLQRVLDFAAAQPEMICQPANGGHGRHPVLLPRKIFLALSTSSAATLKEFLQVRPEEVALCQVDDPGLDVDLDRPEDYLQALRSCASGKTVIE
jgi:molybdenum cofactor cytidylyltransferase